MHVVVGCFLAISRENVDQATKILASAFVLTKPTMECTVLKSKLLSGELAGPDEDVSVSLLLEG